MDCIVAVATEKESCACECRQARAFVFVGWNSAQLVGGWAGTAPNSLVVGLEQRPILWAGTAPIDLGFWAGTAPNCLDWNSVQLPGLKQRPVCRAATMPGSQGCDNAPPIYRAETAPISEGWTSRVRAFAQCSWSRVGNPFRAATMFLRRLVIFCVTPLQRLSSNGS